MKIDLPEELVLKLMAALAAATDIPPPTSAPVEPTVPAGYVKLPVTGHVLPLPSKEEWSFWGYGMVAWDEAKGDIVPGPMTATRMIKQAAIVLGKTEAALVNDRTAWPIVVDCFYNIDAYDPNGAKQRAAEQEEAAKHDWVSRTPAPKPVEPPPGGGTDVPVES